MTEPDVAGNVHCSSGVPGDVNGDGYGRTYCDGGVFMSRLGIEMVHFTRSRILREFSRFICGLREFDCQSVSGSPEKAIVLQGKKAANSWGFCGAAQRSGTPVEGSMSDYQGFENL